MSLFGGESSAPPSPSPSVTDTDHSQEVRPTVEGPSSPPHVRHPNTEYHANESDANQILLADSGSESNISDHDHDHDHDRDHELHTRPNRFKGRRTTWRGYTAADRQVATSLEQLQNSDLGAHLYNAHALKRRVRKPAGELAGLEGWESKECWLKEGSELEYTDVSGEIQTDLVPSRDWTAWPLPPAKLPTPHKRLARTSGQHNEWTIGNMDAHDGSEEMREELLALFLRLAKEQWHTKEADDRLSRKKHHPSQPRTGPQPKSTQSLSLQHSASRAGINMKEDGNDDNTQTDDTETQDEDEEEFANGIGTQRGRMPQPDVFRTPIFLADDAKALRNLQPVINSVLSKLDELALTIRRTRLNHLGLGIYGDTSTQSEFTSETESTETLSRPSSRDQPQSRPSSRQGAQAPSRSTFGKNSRAPAEADSLEDEPQNSDTDTDSEDNGSVISRDETWRAGLMDWSDVLGLAAVKGWDDKVIARAAQRCATLFGEGMSFRSLDENLATKPPAEPVQYTPSTIPAPEIRPAISSVPQKRPLFRTGTLYCPHASCVDSEENFEIPYRVIQHCIKVHNYDPRTNDSDNEDRAFGGVHIDGFLQPIEVQSGWLERAQSRASSEKREQETKREQSVDEINAFIVHSD
ncbi:hypothetical protein GQ44DRAFT_709490 [Phaeosphaeriaceae sp. PMI808]|nr:hypothetical protein GQ44DRAFT_709490 [Phaeosphaeriaceae sp. PMI808]